MPHVIVKMWPGRTVEQKQMLSNKIAEVLRDTIHVPDSSISVAIEEISRLDWKDKVYDPEIVGKKETLYKVPDYTPPE